MNAYGRNIQGAIWLIGIGILLFTGHWWPGIIILVGISMVVGALTRSSRYEPQLAPPPDSPPQPEMPMPPAPAPAAVSPAARTDRPFYDLAWLPAHCPSCGGPLNVKGVEVLDSRTVLCPFCGTKISKAG